MNALNYDAVKAPSNLLNTKDVKDYKGVKSKEESKAVDKIGTPKLSKEASEYYNKLKEKYKDMDFILVSDDMKDKVMNSSVNYATGNKDVVLVDEKTIEKMAKDKDYQKKQEGLIDYARVELDKIKKEVNKGDLKDFVKGFGIKISSNGEMNIFAVMNKSNNIVKTKDIVNKKPLKNTSEVKNSAKIDEVNRKKSNNANSSNANSSNANSSNANLNTDDVLICSLSFNELIKKMNDKVQEWKADNVVTKEEKNVGQHIDFKG